MDFVGVAAPPLFAANEVEQYVSWLSPQSEYRPTSYLQQWVSFWFDDEKRLEAAKMFQLIRFNQIEKYWLTPYLKRDDKFIVSSQQLTALLDSCRDNITTCSDNNELLSLEARLSKALYRIAAETVRYGDFSRVKKGKGTDFANRFLDHGNYLAYGLGATAAWVLGIPHGPGCPCTVKPEEAGWCLILRI